MTGLLGRVRVYIYIHPVLGLGAPMHPMGGVIPVNVDISGSGGSLKSGMAGDEASREEK